MAKWGFNSSSELPASLSAFSVLEEMLMAMMDQMEEKCNSKLRLSGHSEMILEEMIGGRLYTGPMYIKYNTVLRSKTSEPGAIPLRRPPRPLLVRAD